MKGGGGNVNGLQWAIGSDALYQKWEDLLGEPWTVKNIRKAFIEMENYSGTSEQPNLRGTKGPFPVQQGPAEENKATTDFVNAVVSLGFPEINDYNVPAGVIGPFKRWQYMMFRDESRASTDFVFLNKNIVDEDGNGFNGQKLKVLVNTTAMRISKFKGKKPIEVVAISNGKQINIIAKKKILNCSGIHASSFLLHSGVGPTGSLTEVNIPPVIDNPNIGTGLKNHPITVVVFGIPPDVVPNSDANFIYNGGAFLPSALNPQPNVRNVQLIGFLVGAFQGTEPLAPTSFGIAVIVPLQPKSTGIITVYNNDPLKEEKVNEDIYSDQSDINEAMAVYTKYILGIADYLEPLGYPLLSPTRDIINDPVALRDFLNSVDTAHHYSCFGRMGSNPYNGATDKTGHVFGAKDLLEVDAGSFPFISDGNTSAPTQMVAWMIGRMLKKEQKKCKKDKCHTK